MFSTMIAYVCKLNQVHELPIKVFALKAFKYAYVLRLLASSVLVILMQGVLFYTMIAFCV